MFDDTGMDILKKTFPVFVKSDTRTDYGRYTRSSVQNSQTTLTTTISPTGSVTVQSKSSP